MHFIFLFQGVLRIEVLEARDLIKKDIGVFKKGSSDPYVILRGMSECHLLFPLFYIKMLTFFFPQSKQEHYDHKQLLFRHQFNFVCLFVY